MSAIEFSNERSSENEMDWIIKTNSILSKNSLIKGGDATRREITRRNNARDRRRKRDGCTTTTTRERRKRILSVFSLSSHHFIILCAAEFCSLTLSDASDE